MSTRAGKKCVCRLDFHVRIQFGTFQVLYFPTSGNFPCCITSPRGRPGLLDGGPQLLVGLVHLLHAPHEDLQVDPDQGEERRLEVDLPLLVHRHVHPDQPLVGEQVRTLGPESQRRINLSQQRQEISVVDQAPAHQTEMRRETGGIFSRQNWDESKHPSTLAGSL